MSAALIGAACGPSAASTPAGPTVDVKITDANAFEPTDLTIPVGGTVRWTNASSVSHTITFTDSFRIPTDNGTFNHKVGLSDVVTRNFRAQGVYLFFCMIHPGMQGQVTVGGKAAPGSPPGSP